MTQLLQIFNESDMPQLIKDTLIGNLLGDGSITFNLNSLKSNFYLTQSIAHKEYIVFLFAIYAGYTTQNELSLRNFVDSRSGKSYSSFTLTLTASQILGVLYQIFYKGKIKVIQWSIISTLLTPRALATWIIDDGCQVKRGGMTLCTDNFTFAEVFHLILILEIKFGLVCSIHTKNYSNRNKTYYRIYIQKSSLPRLRSLVTPYTHPSIIYKLISL